MRQRLIALGVFAVIIVGLIVLLLTVFEENGVEEEADAPISTRDLLLEEMLGDTVAAFTVTHNSTGESLEAALLGADWGVVSAPEGVDDDLPVDTARLSNAAGTLLSLGPLRTLEDVDDLVQFGLDPPAYTITFETTLAREQTLHVGNINPAETMRYVQVEGDDRVFLVNHFSMSSVTDLVNDPPYVIPTPDPTAAETPTAEP